MASRYNVHRLHFFLNVTHNRYCVICGLKKYEKKYKRIKKFEHCLWGAPITDVQSSPSSIGILPFLLPYPLQLVKDNGSLNIHI